MSIVYLVRKKVFRTAEGVKQLYYAVQRVLQRRGGVTAELLAQRMASRKGMSSGDVQSVDRKSTRLNSSHNNQSRMPSSA